MKIAIAAFLAAFALQGQVRPADVPGWTKAKWGMTEAEILKTFDGQAKELARASHYKDGVARIGIDHLVIEGIECVVHFVVGDDGKLFRVNIRPPDLYTSKTAFQLFEKALMERYGKPDLSRSEASESLTRWTFQSTNIEVSALGTGGRALIVIMYERNKAKENPL